MTTQEGANGEPCLALVLCETCFASDDPDCRDNVVNEYILDTRQFRNLTVYGTDLQYKCPLARHFDLNGDGTVIDPTVNLTCNWDQTWTPITEMPGCVCKNINGLCFDQDLT